MSFEWTRSEVIAVAKESCSQCHGLGLRGKTRRGGEMPCNCVLRAIFRACYTRFRLCLAKEKRMSHVRFEIVGGPERRPVWGRKDEEYVADFCLVSRRILHEREYKIFRLHYLLGADWRLCCRQLAMDRGPFFHDVYRIEQKLGRAFRELEPYALFPLDEYFGPVVRRTLPSEPWKVLRMPDSPLRRNRLLPPVGKAA